MVLINPSIISKQKIPNNFAPYHDHHRNDRHRRHRHHPRRQNFYYNFSPKRQVLLPSIRY
jgi:hypothetical protein